MWQYSGWLLQPLSILLLIWEVGKATQQGIFKHRNIILYYHTLCCCKPWCPPPPQSFQLQELFLWSSILGEQQSDTTEHDFQYDRKTRQIDFIWLLGLTTLSPEHVVDSSIQFFFRGSGTLLKTYCKQQNDSIYITARFFTCQKYPIHKCEVVKLWKLFQLTDSRNAIRTLTSVVFRFILCIVQLAMHHSSLPQLLKVQC
jgi:hypothetical protein